MDVEHLVGAVAAALGADATAERVEAIAQSVMDATLSERRAQDRVIITAFGSDQPGILAGVTRIVARAGCNILDVSMKILQQYFTLIMVADISSMNIPLAELQHQLRAAESELGVRIGAQHEDLFARMHRP